MEGSTGAVLLRRAALAPGRESDVLVAGGRVAAVGPATTVGDAARRAGPVVAVVDLAGRPLLPGLADHHVHLMAAAAARWSVDASPAALSDGGGLGPVLREARRRRPGGWLRVVAYDVEASGALDRDVLDRLGIGPVRVQDRTGIQWVLDSRGLDTVLPEDPIDWPEGLERDGAGRPTGVLVRSDPWLRQRLAEQPGDVGVAPDVGALGRWLARRGVTSVTDAGAGNGPAELARLARAGLGQRVTAMTREADVAVPPEGSGIRLGPVKVLLDDHDLPALDDLAARVAEARARGRAVAVHCVTDAQLVLALSAGLGRGDRIEHGSYVPADLLPLLVEAGPTVVVQPGLVWSRGDRYLEQHTAAERPALHRLGSLVGAGLPVVAGSDAPYGPADPWVGLAAAVERRTRAGLAFGADEALSPRAALDLFLREPGSSGPARAVAPGSPADLVVLDDGWDRLARSPAVAATLVGGELIAGTLPG